MKRPQQEELVDEEEELVDGIRKKLCIRKTPSPEPTPESLECAGCGWQLDTRPHKANYGYCAHCRAEPLCWVGMIGHIGSGAFPLALGAGLHCAGVACGSVALTKHGGR